MLKLKTFKRNILAFIIITRNYCTHKNIEGCLVGGLETRNILWAVEISCGKNYIDSKLSQQNISLACLQTSVHESLKSGSIFYFVRLYINAYNVFNPSVCMREKISMSN